MSKLIGEAHDDVLAYVEEHNTPARKLFERNGFSVVGTIHRVLTNPISPYEWVDEFN